MKNFDLDPDNTPRTLQKHSCPVCGHKKTGIKNRLSQEKYEKIIQQTFDNNIILLSPY